MTTEINKRERGDTLTDHENIKSDLCLSAMAAIAPSETIQSSIKFEKSVYRTLMNLNNQMSSTLCGGVKDINDVCFKIMECLQEIEKQDRLYQKMRHASVDLLMPNLFERKIVASTTTMTDGDEKRCQVVQVDEEGSVKRTQSVETDVNAADQVVQCSFVCDVPNAVAETQSMQDAFKQALQAFIKDVEDVSSVYLEEAKKSQSKSSSLMEVVEKSDDDDDDDDDGDGKISSGYLFKCKAVHNLHEKLIKQVEACDSFCEFQKRMAHNLKVINGRKVDSNKSFCCYHRRLQKATEKAAAKAAKIAEQKKQEQVQHKQQQQQQQQQKKRNLASKYSDSLWFTWTPKSGKDKAKANKKHKGQWKKQPQQQQKLTVENTLLVSTTKDEKPAKKEEETPSLSFQPPSSIPSDYDTWHKYNTGHLKPASRTLNCVDILEELTENDVKPIKSEYPRRDDIPSNRRQLTVKDSFLYQMVYGRNNRSVLEILSSVEQPRPCSAAGALLPPPPSPSCEKLSLTTLSTIRPVSGGDSRSCSFPVRPPSATPLTPSSPSDKFLTRRLSAGRATKKTPSSKSTSDRFAARKSSSVASAPKKSPAKGAARSKRRKVKGKVSSEHSSARLKENTAAKKATNDKIVSKLQKYINDPHLRYRTTITVMPVHVYHHPNPITLHIGGDGAKPTPTTNTKPTRKSSTSTTTSPRDTTTLSTKKLWANKYQKSVCQHLVSFIEKQEPHALMVEPKKQKRRSLNTPRSAPSARKVALSSRNRGDVGRTKMLSSMGVLASIDRKGLEENIQKIIDMIELKIIDIISDPQKQNTDTFAEIERQITDVLKELRAMGAGPQQVRRIRREDLKLTALETILDLEVVGDSVVNLLKKDTPKSQTTTDLLATSEDSVEEKCVVTSACAPEKNITTVSSQKFLTPFMQELKKHRMEIKKKASYQNVIEFLDNLSNMPHDCAIVLFYRDLLRKAEIWQQAQVFFCKELTCPVRLYNIRVNDAAQTVAPLEIAVQTQRKENHAMLVQSYLLTDIATGVEHKMADVETQHNNMAATLPPPPPPPQQQQLMFVANQPHKIFADETHKVQYLNQFYGLLFTLMYFALTFDYECA